MPSELHCPTARLDLANRSAELPRLAAWIEAQARVLALPATVAHDVNLALEEWVVNIISYAYADTAAHTIAVTLWRQPGRLCLEIDDDGRPFDPTVHPPPDTNAPLDQRKIGGLGIHFIRQTMEAMSYHRRDNHNVLTLSKLLPATGSEEPSRPV
jgi:anti-sigma regulatory factor (Ser/Thr protein kinase)